MDHPSNDDWGRGFESTPFFYKYNPGAFLWRALHCMPCQFWFGIGSYMQPGAPRRGDWQNSWHPGASRPKSTAAASWDKRNTIAHRRSAAAGS